MQFNEMNLIKPLLTAVQNSGYQTPTPIQAQTIPLALAGKDILGCAQTGTGKTAAFVLPIIQRLYEEKTPRSSSRPIRALVLAPTRELAIQNYDTFQLFERSLGINSTVVFGGVNQAKQVQELRRGVDVLVATPGRLLDLIGQGFVSLARLEIFVLDEADRMLDMGFIHDVKRIIALLPKPRQTMLFSATMPPEVESLALSLLTKPATVKVDPVTSTVDKIEQSVYFVSREDKKSLLLHLLQEKGIDTALVFTRTKSNADQVVRILRRSKIKAMAIHGDKSQNAREAALGSFKAGEISVLAATDIAARGIDIAELPYVINYNIPEESETYIHRIGRTGRAGLGGRAISLCSSDELEDWRAIEKLTHLHIPVAQCPWSIENMQPTEKPKKQPRPPRRERGAAAEPRMKPEAKQKAPAETAAYSAQPTGKNVNRPAKFIDKGAKLKAPAETAAPSAQPTGNNSSRPAGFADRGARQKAPADTGRYQKMQPQVGSDISARLAAELEQSPRSYAMSDINFGGALPAHDADSGITSAVERALQNAISATTATVHLSDIEGLGDDDDYGDEYDEYDNDQAPANNNQAPAGSGRAPANNNQAPAGNGRAPANNNQAPANNNQATAGNNQAPTGGGRAPAGNGRAPANNNQAPAGNGRAPANNNQAPAGGSSDTAAASQGGAAHKRRRRGGRGRKKPSGSAE